MICIIYKNNILYNITYIKINVMKFVYVPSNKKFTIHTALNHHYMFIIMFGANTD